MEPFATLGVRDTTAERRRPTIYDADLNGVEEAVLPDDPPSRRIRTPAVRPPLVR